MVTIVKPSRARLQPQTRRQISEPHNTTMNTLRLFGGVILSQLCKLLHKNLAHIDVNNSDVVKHVVHFAEMMTDLVCADCFSVNYRQLMHFLSLFIARLQAAEPSGYTQEPAVGHLAKPLCALHKTTNRVVVHLLSHLHQAPDRLSTFVQALGDHVNVVFSANNTDAPMLVLIAHGVFGFFASEEMAVRHSAMRVWGHLLEHRRSVLMPLLAYHDAEGTGASLYTDGFSQLVVCSAESKGDEYDAAVAVAILEFDEWLRGPAPGRHTGGIVDSSRWARVAALVHENAAKQRVKVHVLSGEQQYHAHVQKRHYKHRLARMHKCRRRLCDEEDARRTMQSAAADAERKAVAQWRQLVRGRWQNLESRSVFTRQQWTRDKQPLLRERGVLGQAWEDLEDCARRQVASDLSQAHVPAHTNSLQGRQVGSAVAYACAHGVDAAFAARPSVVTWLQCSPVHTEDHKTSRRATLSGSVRESSMSWQSSPAHRKELGGSSGARAGESGLGAKRLWWRLDQTEGPQRMRRRLELDVLQVCRVRASICGIRIYVWHPMYGRRKTSILYNLCMVSYTTIWRSFFFFFFFWFVRPKLT